MRLRITTEPQLGASYDQLLRLARAAEASGFDGFFRSDHYLMNHGDGPLRPGPSDAWMTLAGLARDTSTIRLGTLVTPVTFRHPGPLAVAIAQVDAMSGGRLELGLGAGWFEQEHLAHGIPFPSNRVRSEMLEELLAILRAWWSTPWGETFDHRGAHYQLTGCPALPKPSQERIPIIIGGWGRRRTPALAAAYADEYNVAFGTPSQCAAQFDRVRAACTPLNRDPATVRRSTVVTVCCGETLAEAGARAERSGWTVERMRAQAGRVVGTVDEVIVALAEYASAGVDAIYLQLLNMDDTEHVQLLADRVAPALASL